jgi:hypothetical protein
MEKAWAPETGGGRINDLSLQEQIIRKNETIEQLIAEGNPVAVITPFT